MCLIQTTSMECVHDNMYVINNLQLSRVRASSTHISIAKPLAFRVSVIIKVRGSENLVATPHQVRASDGECRIVRLAADGRLCPPSMMSTRSTAFVCLGPDGNVLSSIALTQRDRPWLTSASSFQQELFGRAMRDLCQQLDSEASRESADPTVTWSPMERWAILAKHIPFPRGHKDAKHLRCLRQGTPTRLSLDLILLNFYRPHTFTPIPLKPAFSKSVLPPLQLSPTLSPAKAPKEPISPCSIVNLQLDDVPPTHELPSSFIGRSCRLYRATYVLAAALETRPSADEL